MQSPTSGSAQEDLHRDCSRRFKLIYNHCALIVPEGLLGILRQHLRVRSTPISRYSQSASSRFVYICHNLHSTPMHRTNYQYPKVMLQAPECSPSMIVP